MTDEIDLSISDDNGTKIDVLYSAIRQLYNREFILPRLENY